MDCIQYRMATEQDIDEIMELVQGAVSTMEAQGIFQWDCIYPSREDFLQDIAAETLFLAVLGGRITAVCTVNEECDADYRNGNWHAEEPFAVIHRLCVHHAFSGRGIARAFLRFIEETLRARKFHSIRLDVFSQNPVALKLYESANYIMAGTADWRKGRFFLMEKQL